MVRYVLDYFLVQISYFLESPLATWQLLSVKK